MLYRSKENPKKVKNKFVEIILCLFAPKASGFGSNFVLTNLHQWRSVVSLKKNGAGIVSLKIFNGYVDQTKKILNISISDSVYFISKLFLKKLVEIYELQSCLLKQELEYDEIYEDNWEQKENEWLLYLKTTFYQLPSVMLDIQ